MDIVNDVMKVADTGFHPRASASFLSSQCLTLGSRKKDDVIRVADTGSL
ncbi:hypothetical protein [Wolbachia endosymbiont (group A) of Ennomos erosarius]